jgi:hypothetical protein
LGAGERRRTSWGDFYAADPSDADFAGAPAVLLVELEESLDFVVVEVSFVVEDSLVALSFEADVDAVDFLPESRESVL